MNFLHTSSSGQPSTDAREAGTAPSRPEVVGARSERARERGLKRSAGSIARVLLDTVAAGAWSGDGVRSSSRAWSGRGGAAAGWMGCERTESGSATASRDGKEGMADVPRWPVLHLLVVGSAGEVVVALRPACRAASSEASRAGRRRRPRCRRVRGRARACAGGREDAHHQLAAPAMPTPARAPAPALVPRTSSLAVGWPSWTAERRPESTVSSSVRKAPVQRARRPPVRKPPLMPAHRTR